MQTVINVHDFKTNYSKYLAEVRRGRTVIVGLRGEPVAELKPFKHPTPLRKRQVGAFKGKIWMSPDFDEPMTELWELITNKPTGQ